MVAIGGDNGRKWLVQGSDADSYDLLSKLAFQSKNTHIPDLLRRKWRRGIQEKIRHEFRGRTLTIVFWRVTKETRTVLVWDNPYVGSLHHKTFLTFHSKSGIEGER
jgi:hypothetical protein